MKRSDTSRPRATSACAWPRHAGARPWASQGGSAQRANRVRRTAGRARGPQAADADGRSIAERSRRRTSGTEGRASTCMRTRIPTASGRATGRPRARRCAGSVHPRQSLRHARVRHQGTSRSDRGAGLLHAQAPSRHGNLRRHGVEPHHGHQGQPVGDHPHGRDEGRLGPDRVDAELGLGEQHPSSWRARPLRRRSWRWPVPGAAVLDRTIRSRATAASCCRKSKRRCR